MTFTFVTVTADYDLANGLDPVGAITFVPSEPMVNDETVVSAAVTRPLDIDGALLLDLAANTDPDTLPTDTTYLVEEAINGVTRRYSVVIPHDAGSLIDLSSLTRTEIEALPAAVPSTVFPQVTFPVAGPPGPPGPQGPAGPPGSSGSGGVTFGTTAGTAAEGNDSRIVGAAQKSANLSDLASASTALTNLGLGGAATLAVGTSVGTVAAGDDGRITGNVATLNNLTKVHAVGNSGSALTIDASSTSGLAKTITLTANCTFTLTGASAGSVASLELVLKQDATGSRTVTWPASVKWSGGAPTLSTAANAVDRVVLASYDAGTTWYADLVGTGYA